MACELSDSSTPPIKTTSYIPTIPRWQKTDSIRHLVKFWAVVFLDNLYSSCFHVDKNYASKLSDSSLSGINCRVFLENCLFFYFQLIAEVQTPAFEVCMIVQICTYILYCGANFEGLKSRMRMPFPRVV